MREILNFQDFKLLILIRLHERRHIVRNNVISCAPNGDSFNLTSTNPIEPKLRITSDRYARDASRPSLRDLTLFSLRLNHARGYLTIL